jgi:DNA-binding response OmpR family regulator
VDAGRIVLAEDDPALRDLLARRLTSEGYDVRLLDTPRRLAECGDLDADLVISAFSDHGPTIHDVRQQSDVLLVAMMPTNTGHGRA